MAFRGDPKIESWFHAMRRVELDSNIGGDFAVRRTFSTVSTPAGPSRASSGNLKSERTNRPRAPKPGIRFS
ncbi:hypothetical protein, partial [Mesorhizobium sp.]|uniref:hypothetical protein n=1 Tax=Mesorhizobium sp. TaxID=1871066 RepID=UPI0025E0F77B